MKTATPTIDKRSELLSAFISQEELSDYLGLSLRTLQRMFQERRGPARIKVGSLILYKIESVQDWLISLEQKPVRSRR